MASYRRRSAPRCATSWLTAALALAILCLPLITEAGVPNPTITGPIAAAVILGDSSRDYPFLATDARSAAGGLNLHQK